jgi:ribosome biogenesis GTPase
MSFEEHRFEGPDRGLADLGWDLHWSELFKRHAPAGTLPARVAMQHRGSYTVFAGEDELPAEVLGRLRHMAAGSGDLPAVGDWVAIRAYTDGKGIIHAVLPRKSSFTRKSAGLETTEQVLASNIDVVFVIAALDVDLNLRRVERYLTMAWGSGAVPVMVLTKADLSDDVSFDLAAFAPVASGVEIHTVSAVTGAGVDDLRGYLQANRTATLLGPSGSGKSTLVNALLGADLLAVAPIRHDGRGRHTTTHRQLVRIPGGGLIIDTPGMRELQLWEPGTGLADAFDDIDALAAGCRFTDCRHENEPGCAVVAAVAAGDLPEERLASFKKLQRELRHLERKRDVRARSEERRKWKSINKALKAAPKTHDRARRR